LAQGFFAHQPLVLAAFFSPNPAMTGGAVQGKSGSDIRTKPSIQMYVAILTAMIGAIMFGIDCGNFGAVQGFQSFHREWCVGHFGNAITCGEDAAHGASHNAKWLGTFVQWSSLLLFIGAAGGALVLAPLITKNFGRRPCISCGAMITLLGSLLTSYLSFASIPLFYFGRFATGFGVGVCCFALPMYNSEVSAPQIRGVTGSLFQVNVVVGQVIASILTFFDHHWQVGMLLPGIAGALIAVSIWFTPESPRYVMAKKGYQEGVKVLAKFRSGDVAAEAEDMNEQLLTEAAAGQVAYSQLFSDPNLRKRVLIACWLQIAQQFTGFNALVMFSSTLFTDMGFSDPFMVNMAFTGVQLAGLLAGISFLDSSIGGRRIQLLAVTIALIPLFLLTGLASLFEWAHAFALVLVCLIGFTWQCAWGMIPWVYPSEIFSMAERDRAMSLAVFVQYGSNAVLMPVVPALMSSVGSGGMLLFFAGFNVLNLFFIFKCIEETKGVPLEMIPGLFGVVDSALKNVAEAEKV